MQPAHARFEVALLVVDGNHDIENRLDLAQSQMLTWWQGTQWRLGRRWRRHTDDGRQPPCHGGVVNLWVGYESGGERQGGGERRRGRRETGGPQHVV
ncbi:hypothetical protein GCM10010211_84800 [Streptomyces albospinus]|uniref:Uncharacterized protein n=1 Tax=Streptomyces albospinus TaxID=285515 RepID=A0ABQ2VP82_9ACTN|nr:hypothetical protein GCM10010211_84800 [Streptomyces albospinus]